MFLFSVIKILYFATVLSAANIPLTTEKPYSLQQDAHLTPKTDVHDVSGIFESSAKSVKGTKQVLEQRPIALEGGSSVIANDSTVSESNSLKGLDQNTTTGQSFNNTALSSNYPNTSHKTVQTEGGLLEIPVSTAAVSETTKLVPNGATDFIKEPFQLNVGDESDHRSVVPRKGVSQKIVPRKGAEPYEPFPDLEDNVEMKPPACNCCEILSSEQNSGNYSADPKCLSCCNVSDSKKPSISTSSISADIKSADNNTNDHDFKIADINVNSTDIKNETTLLNVANSTLNDIYRAYPPLKKKSKPLVTSDTDSDQKLQKIPPPSSSEKSDFVIPVVLLILAVPVVVVLGMLFYRKGTEFWERRHYSKMDFLIDGMYNE